MSFKIGDPRLYQAVRRLKKLDLYERVCDFLESPVIESAIEKEFKKILKKFKSIERRIPKELRARIPVLNEKYTYRYFFECVILENICGIANTFYIAIKEDPGMCINNGHLRVWINEEFKRSLTEDAINCIKITKEEYLIDYLSELYRNYIPTDIPRDIAERILSITGGTEIIPLNLLWDDDEED